MRSSGKTTTIMTMQVQVLLLASVYATSCLFCFVDCLSQSQMGCNYFLSPTDITAETVIGTIRLPIMRTALHYLPNQHCEWNIRAKNPDHVIQVFIKTCKIQGHDLRDQCLRDYLDFYEEQDSGKQIFMGRYCGNRCDGRLLVTSSSHMMIHFISDPHFEYEGFELTYMAQPKKEDNSSDNSTTVLAVAIPVGLISLTVAIIVVVYFYRRWFMPKRSQSSHHPSSSSSSSFPPPPPSSSSHTPCQHNRTPQDQQQHDPSLHPQLIVSLDNSADSDEPWRNSARRSGYDIPYNDDATTPSFDYDPTPEVVLPAYSSHEVAPLQVDISAENSDSNALSSSRIQGRRRSNDQRPHSSATFSTTPNPVSPAGDNNGRSRTPPPSYEFTMMHDRMLQQQEEGGDAILPDYDSVVKSDELQQHSNSESRV